MQRQPAMDGTVNLRSVDGTVPDDKTDLPRLREGLKALSKAETDNQLELAELLSKAFAVSAHREWGFATWEDFIEQEMAMSKRRAQYLMGIHQWFVGVLKDRKVVDSVKHLGWSKLRLLKRVADASNIKEWLDRAEQMSFRQLEEFIKQLQSEDGGDDGKDPGTISTVSFKLYTEQEQVVEEALELAKDVAESEKRGHLLTLVCEDFLSSNRFNMRPGHRMQELYLSRIANVLDINIVASERGSGVIITGKQAVLKQAKALPQTEKKALIRAMTEDESLALLSKKDRKAIWERLSAEFA